jgi:hypothetical protein
MAAVSQPGSRAGLITALVVFVVLFFVAAIFAVVKGIDDKDKEKKLTELQKRYQETITDQEMTGTDYQALSASRQADQSRTVFDLLLSQRNALATRATGKSMDGAEALKAVDALVLAANNRLSPAGVSVPGTSLSGAVSVLTEAVLQRHEQVEQLKAQLAKSNQDMKGQVVAYKTEMDEHRKAFEGAKTEAAGASQQSATYRQGKDEQLAKLEKDLVDAVEKARKSEEDLKTQISAKEEEIRKLQTDTKRLVAIVDRYRPKNPADSMIRRADGRVIQVSRNNTVYISLGLGQQITPGMTFEIYDRDLGIPKSTTEGEAEVLPAGKGSLEVTRVGSTSSECRVIKATTGSQIIEGDLIANLIYDPNVKLHFKVYGDFDVDQNNVATPGEADIVKRLITQWGGALTEDITIDTDFVVMGKEPVIPQYTAEQLRDDPIAQFNVEKAMKALSEYEAVRTKALDMHVPVLSQNRFLYLIGFYDQARR